MQEVKTTSSDNIGLSFIRTDGGTQARAGLNEATVIEYLDAMREGVEFPPVVLFYDGTDYWLADGFHRVEARRRFKEEGRGSIIAADVRQGTRRDAVLYAAGANDDHGLRRSADDKRRAVLCLLEDKEWGAWADRAIARQCRVSPTFVGKVRAEAGLTVHVDSEERTYTTRHGTTATMDTSKIGNGGAAYEAIHSLQSSVLDFFKRVCTGNADVIKSLEDMKADHKSGHWSVLSMDLARKGKIYRVNDLRQAVNNALDSMRFTASQAVVSQPSEPAQETVDDQAAIDATLLRALNVYRDSGERWQELAKRGLTSEELKQEISRIWGLGGGSSGPGLAPYYRKGGADPKFWYNTFGPDEKPTLRGAALIGQARVVLQMPFPQPVSERDRPPEPVYPFAEKKNSPFSVGDIVRVRDGGWEGKIGKVQEIGTDCAFISCQMEVKYPDKPSEIRAVSTWFPFDRLDAATEPVAAADGEHCLDCGKPMSGGGVCNECFATCVTDTPAAVLDSEQTEPTPKPRIAPFVMGHFQVANEALARIYTAIPKSRTDDIHDFAALIATLERLERRIGAEYDMS